MAIHSRSKVGGEGELLFLTLFRILKCSVDHELVQKLFFFFFRYVGLFWSRQAVNVVAESTLPVEEEIVVETNAEKFLCDLCGVDEFRSAAEYERHRREKHGDEGKFKYVLFKIFTMKNI